MNKLICGNCRKELQNSDIVAQTKSMDGKPAIPFRYLCVACSRLPKNDLLKSK